MSRKIALRAVAFVTCLALPLACGGGDVAAPITTTPVTTTPTSTTANTIAKVNALLTEINSGESAASQSYSAGGVGSAPPPPSADIVPSTSLNSRALFATAPAEDAAKCVLDSLTVRFNCPPHAQPNGLVSTAYFQILDTLNQPQTHFDSLSTGALRKVTDLTGTTNQPLMTQNGPVAATQTTNNHNELILAGIRAGNHKQNGTGTMKQVIDATGMTEANITANTTTADFAFSQGKPYPTSGTLTAVVVTVQNGSTSTTNQVTTYDGTPIAKLVITFLHGGSRTCTYDMTSTAPATCVNTP